MVRSVVQSSQWASLLSLDSLFSAFCCHGMMRWVFVTPSPCDICENTSATSNMFHPQQGDNGGHGPRTSEGGTCDHHTRVHKFTLLFVVTPIRCRQSGI
ncbi:hypothetical protein BKA83DRAFT_4213926 [Pisolithus microcarpus]|nr:hypothetical protein BKA83DRAFT_4213926 [Pisolithus microcarpus]